MDIAKINGIVRCRHREFVNLNNDEVVEKQPLKSVLVHKCEGLEVYQKSKGLQRFYKIIKK